MAFSLGRLFAMRSRMVLFLIGVFFAGAVCFGLVNRMRYQDFNKLETPLSDFIVAGLSQKRLKKQIYNMQNGDLALGIPSLADCPLVLAVRCEEKLLFQHQCTAQKISVVKIFRGEDLSEGDVIYLVNNSSLVWFYDDEHAQVLRGYYGANMNYANEMIPGKNYLVFLDHRVDTFRSEEYWVLFEGSPATRFCYDEIVNHPAVRIDDPDAGNSVFYKEVANCEFFLLSEEAIKEMAEFKGKLLKEYPLP